MIDNSFFSVDDDLNIILMDHRWICIALVESWRRHLSTTMVVVIHVVAERTGLREVGRTLRLLDLPHVVLMGHLLLGAGYLMAELVFIW